jgi:hypothetical protein
MKLVMQQTALRVVFQNLTRLQPPDQTMNVLMENE